MTQDLQVPGDQTPGMARCLGWSGCAQDQETERDVMQGAQIQTLIDRNSTQSADNLERSKTEAQNKYLRLSADFDNFRKRSVSSLITYAGFLYALCFHVNTWRHS